MEGLQQQFEDSSGIAGYYISHAAAKVDLFQYKVGQWGDTEKNFLRQLMRI